MEISELSECYIYTLPNELLYIILSILPTDSLLKVTPLSRRFHALALRILHNRLTLAASLDNHTLMLECYHPSAKLTAGKMYCTYLGTDGLEDALDYGEHEEVGQLAHLRGLYSRFLPQRKELERLIQRRPGDIPGSRTWATELQAEAQAERRKRVENGLLPSETVSLDAHELFSQLCVVSHMAKMAPGRAVIQSFVELSDGMIRVWRDWMLRQSTSSGGKDGGVMRPSEDESILWVNNAGQDVGIKFKVQERRFRRDNPILYADEEEVAVSYSVEFQEFLVRTTHLLRMVEESLLQQHANVSGNTRAIVFGSFG